MLKSFGVKGITNTMRYTFLGILFGFLFPVLGTFMTIWSEGLSLWEGLFLVQSTNSLLWIIDTAPIFLGSAAFWLGRKQDRLVEFNNNLEEKVKDKTASLEREIEEGKAREQELIEMRKAAEMGVEIKDQFLSNMSHEIRTPMNGILGMTDLLVKQTNPNKEQKEYLSLIEYSAKNLLVIINDILDVSKANADKLELHKENFSLNKLLNNLEATLRITASEKEIFLKVQKNDDVPDLHYGDAVRLYQVLMNLGSNAIKFTEKGKVELFVSLIEKKEEGNLLQFTVSDTGIGIPQHFQGHIFGQFTQIDDRIGKRFSGTGLGLSIVQKLVEVFEGKLTLESEEQKGSHFHVDLMLEVPVKNGQVATASVKPQLSKKRRSELKVILAEDNAINQVFAKSALNRLGIEVEVAVNGMEVIHMLDEEHYDLILMDVQMPEMDGLEATKYIRNEMSPPNRDIKIIAVTAAVMKKEIDSCFEAGVNDYLSKPFNPDDLLDKITSVIM